MEFDPSFEFECPKWCDFELESSEDETSLNDSWFEREHPLHEPKDKEKHDKELKPLIDLNEIENYGKKSTSSTTSNKKYKQSKKSLGVKRSVMLKRGSAGRRKLPEICETTSQQSNEDIHGDDQVDNKVSNDDDLYQKHDITLPITINSPLRGERTPNLLHSPMRGPPFSPYSMNSPKRTLLSKAITNTASTNKPKKRRRLPTIPCAENKEVVSFLPVRGNSSSEDTQNSQAIDTKTIATTSESSPFILDPKSSNNSSNSTITCKPKRSPIATTSESNSFRLDPKPSNSSNSKITCKPKRSPIATTSESSPFRLDPKSSNNSSNSKITCKPKRSPLETTITDKDHETNENMSVEDLLKLHNQKVMTSKCKYDINGRRLLQPQNNTLSSVASGTTKECPDTKRDYVSTRERDVIPKDHTLQSDNIGEHGNTMTLIDKSRSESDEISVEDLLKLHNKKINASKCKYDTNGRRIQPANPTFCPAPSHCKPDANKSPKSKPTTTLTNKRPSSSNDSVISKAKHHRQSCVAVPTRTGTNKEALRPHHSNMTKTTHTLTDHNSTTTSLKRSLTSADVKSTQKNKRRSCVAAPGAISSSMHGKTAAQNALKQKRRSCFAAPQSQKKIESQDVIDETDQELKTLIARHNEKLAMLK